MDDTPARSKKKEKKTKKNQTRANRFKWFQALFSAGLLVCDLEIKYSKKTQLTTTKNKSIINNWIRVAQRPFIIEWRFLRLPLWWHATATRFFVVICHWAGAWTALIAWHEHIRQPGCRLPGWNHNYLY